MAVIWEKGVFRTVPLNLVLSDELGVCGRREEEQIGRECSSFLDTYAQARYASVFFRCRCGQ